MKIYRDRSKRLLGLSQSTCIDTVLKRFSMKNFKKDYLPIGQEIFFLKNDCPTTPQEREHMSLILYASIVGSIMCTMTCTWSDVAFSLGVVSRYHSDPDENHWKVVKTILNYLWNTKDQWLIYGESDLKFMRFTDFNFQSDHDDSKSMSEYIYIINGRAICWKSFKQHIVVDSTCEMEYIAASDVVKKTVWLRKFINKLGVASSLNGPILLYCDSTSAITQTKKSKSYQQIKHILHCYHLIWEIVDRDNIELQKIDGKENLADPFTKALDVKEFEAYKSKMGIQYCTDWL